MKEIKKEIKLDINSAVEMGTALIHSGTHAFCLNTEFGRIPVEVWNEKYAMYNSSATKWEYAPASSDWVIENRNADYRWYVKILKIPGQSRVITKMQLIRELSAVMFASISGHMPDEEDLTALTNVYLDTYVEYVGSSRFKDAFCRQYVKHICGVKALHRHNHQMIANEVTRAMKSETSYTKMVRTETSRRLQEVGLLSCNFLNDFYSMLAGLVLSYRVTRRNKSEEYKAIMEDGDGEITAYQLIEKLLKDE